MYGKWIGQKDKKNERKKFRVTNTKKICDLGLFRSRSYCDQF